MASESAVSFREGQGLNLTNITSKLIPDYIGLTIQADTCHSNVHSHLTRKEYFDKERLKADRYTIRPTMIYVGTFDLYSLVLTKASDDITRPERRETWRERVSLKPAP